MDFRKTNNPAPRNLERSFPVQISFQLNGIYENPSPPTGSGNGNGNGGNILTEKNQCEAKNIQRKQIIFCKAELFRRLGLWIWANLFFFCRWGWWLLAPTNSSSSSSSSSSSTNPFQKRLGLKHNDSSLSSMSPNWSEFWRWRKGWWGWWVTWGWQAWTSPSTNYINSTRRCMIWQTSSGFGIRWWW